MVIINIKEEMKESRDRIKKLQNQIPNCYNPDLKRHLAYELHQEQLKLESYELLIELSKKAGGF